MIWLTKLGNAQGSIILFEPSTSEHLSSRTLDQIPVTALAPASDCRTFAIGSVSLEYLIPCLDKHQLTLPSGIKMDHCLCAPFSLASPFFTISAQQERPRRLSLFHGTHPPQGRGLICLLLKRTMVTCEFGVWPSRTTPMTRPRWSGYSRGLTTSPRARTGWAGQRTAASFNSPIRKFSYQPEVPGVPGFQGTRN
jgi:hypothetical protein